MPWKNEVDSKPHVNAQKIHKIDNPNKFARTPMSDLVGEVQAIMMNPPWNLGDKPTPGRISMKEFQASFCVPPQIMKDGLVFIWVEKEIIH